MLDSSSSIRPPLVVPEGARRTDSATVDVFDPALAEHPTRIVDREAIVDMLHVTDRPDIVDAYRVAMQRGDRFPPVSVVRLLGIWFVADGHKRFTAFRTLGPRQIVVEVWPVRRWLRDQADQARATWRRWRAALSRDPDAPRLRIVLAAEMAHLRRMLVCLVRSRADRPESMTSRAPGAASRLAAVAWQHRNLVSRTAIGFLVLSLSQLSLTWLVKLWIDGPLSHDSSTASPLPVATVLLVCVLSVAVFVAHYGLGALNAAMIRHLRRDLQSHLLDLEVAAVESSAGGDLVARLLQDAETAGRFAGEVVRRGLGDAFVFAGALTMLLVIDRHLFGLIVLIAPLGVIGHSLVASAIRKRSLAAQERLGRLSARFAEQVSGHKTIKGYGMEGWERQRFDVENQAYTQALLGVERWSAFALASIWLVTGFALLAVGLYAGHALSVGRLAAGDFLIFCLFGAQVVEPVRRLGELSTLAQRGLSAGQRLYEVLDRCTLEPPQGDELSEPVRGEIQFEGVRFAYSAARSVLVNATFNLAARETVAIVSPSGGGKSTIASLLVRFYAVDAGVIRLDGHELSTLRIADVRRSIRVVTQDPFIFAGTVLENIRYGMSDASASSIDEAIYRAGLESWLQALPAGSGAILEEAGRNLSGGQKQRLALARAILARPAVLVLDEATSAVDSDTEERIMARLDEWLQQRTVILMAHRLSTVLRLPRALVLEAGCIVEDGAPLELLQRSSHFSRIFRDQMV